MFRIIALTLFVFISPWAVSAQECNPPYEMVTRLFQPEPGAYTVWDSVYDELDYEEHFSSGLALDDGSVLAVGERISVLTGVKEILFVVYDRLGRKIKESFFSLKGAQNIVKIHKRPGGGYALIVNIENNERSEIWLGFFDDNFNLQSRRFFTENSYDLSATDVIPSLNSGWLISVSRSRSYGKGDELVHFENGRVFLIDSDGRKVQERSYSPGGNDHISSLSVLKRGGEGIGYIATGYFINNSGKKIAWALRLDSDLALNWQSEYRRGLSAKFKNVIGYFDAYILAFGDVVPSHGRGLGTWLALIDVDDGNVLWQRYFYDQGETHKHAARGLQVYKDGRIVLMMSAESLVGEKPQTNDDYLNVDYTDYTHLLELSARGILLGGDTYFHGDGVSINQLVLGKSEERIMFGFTRSSPSEGGKAKEKSPQVSEPLSEVDNIVLPDVELSKKAKKGLELLKKKISSQELVQQKELANLGKAILKKGWVVVGDKLDAYNDPCSN